MQAPVALVIKVYSNAGHERQQVDLERNSSRSLKEENSNLSTFLLQIPWSRGLLTQSLVVVRYGLTSGCQDIMQHTLRSSKARRVEAGRSVQVILEDKDISPFLMCAFLIYLRPFLCDYLIRAMHHLLFMLMEPDINQKLQAWKILLTLFRFTKWTIGYRLHVPAMAKPLLTSTAWGPEMILWSAYRWPSTKVYLYHLA